MHTRRMPCEHESKDQGDASQSQGMSKTPANRQKLQEMEQIPLMAVRRSQPCPYLDLGLLASRTMRQYLSVV